MTVTDLTGPLRELADQRPRLERCGCLAGETCTRCGRVRALARRMREQGATDVTIAARIGAPVEAVVLQETLDHRAETLQTAGLDELRQRERMITAFGITGGHGPGRIRSGKAVPNRPLREEWERRRVETERASLLDGEAYKAHRSAKPFLNMMATRMASSGQMDTSRLQRALGLMPESSSTKSRVLRDGTTRRYRPRKTYRQVMPLDMAERMAAVWGMDLHDLINDHPAMQSMAT